MARVPKAVDPTEHLLDSAAATRPCERRRYLRVGRTAGRVGEREPIDAEGLFRDNQSRARAEERRHEPVIKPTSRQRPEPSVPEYVVAGVNVAVLRPTGKIEGVARSHSGPGEAGSRTPNSALWPPLEDTGPIPPATKAVRSPIPRRSRRPLESWLPPTRPSGFREVRIRAASPRRSRFRRAAPQARRPK